MATSIVKQDLPEIQPTRQELQGLAKIISVGFKAYKNAGYPPCYKDFLQALIDVNYWACEAINIVGEQQMQGAPIKKENVYNWISYTNSERKAATLLKQIYASLLYLG